MTALPRPPSHPEAALVLAGRGRVLVAERLRLRHLAGQLGLVVTAEVPFRRRRRGSAADQLLEALPDETTTVLVERISALGRDPLSALLVAARLSVSGRTLVSAEEPWAGSLHEVLPLLGEWLAESVREQRALVARAALARARCEGRRLGRPRKDLGDPAAVHRLAREVGVALASSRLNCGETTLRRFLRANPAPCSTQTIEVLQ